MLPRNRRESPLQSADMNFASAKCGTRELVGEPDPIDPVTTKCSEAVTSHQVTRSGTACACREILVPTISPATLGLPGAKKAVCGRQTGRFLQENQAGPRPRARGLPRRAAPPDSAPPAVVSASEPFRLPTPRPR